MGDAVKSAALANGTDDWPTIQGELDTLASREYASYSRTLKLPAGRVGVSRPLVMRTKSTHAAGIHLRGASNGDTQLVPVGDFASGPYVLVRDSTPNTTPVNLGPSLVTGPGQALRAQPDGPILNLHSDPRTQLGSLSAMTVEFFVKRVAAVGSKTCLVNYGLPITGNVGWNINIGELVDTFQVTWGEFFERTASAPFTVGTVYYVALVFDGSSVSLYQGIPGETVSRVLHLTGTAGTVPSLPGTAGNLVIGTDGAPDPSYRGWGSPDAWVDGLRLSNTARYSGASFTAPTEKPTCDANTLLLLNFDEVDRDFVIGRTGITGYPYLPGTKCYFVPYPAANGSLLSNVRVSDLAMGDDGCNLCGVYATGAILSTYERLYFRGVWNAIRLDANTYSTTVKDVYGVCAGYGLMQLQDSESVRVDNLNFERCGAFGIFAQGAIGGTYTHTRLTPWAASTGLIYLKADNLTFDGLQTDDDGSAPQMPYTILAEGHVSILRPTFRMRGGILTGSNARPLIRCVNGATVDLDAVSVYRNAGNTVPLIQFDSQPFTEGRAWLYPGAQSQGTFTVANHPQWLTTNATGA